MLSFVTYHLKEDETPSWLTIGLNSAGKAEYTGPTDVAQTKLEFRLYALKELIKSNHTLNWAEVESAIQGKTVGNVAKLIAQYPNKTSGILNLVAGRLAIAGSNNFMAHVGYSKKKTSFDQSLVGVWETNSGGRVFKKEIETNGNWYNIGEVEFEVSTDGQSLEEPIGYPNLFSRDSGSGTSIAGTWLRNHVDDNIIEEVEYRADNTYRLLWKELDTGNPINEYQGTYAVNGNELFRKEYFGDSATASNELTLNVIHGPTAVGTYQVAGDGKSWTWTIGSTTTNFTKSP
jgi:hypothetical protein